MNFEVIAMNRKAVIIMQWIGIRCAAEYLRKRGYSINEAINILLRRTSC